jgi:hypothetical protein
MKPRTIIVVAAALAASACAQGARIDAMSDPGSARATALRSPYRQAIAVDRVTGGQDTNPLWVSKVGNADFRGALRNSLQANGLRAVRPQRARYRLSAKLVTLDQPLVGLSFTVKSSVKYTLRDTRTGRAAYDDIVSAAYTATFGDSVLGVERLRLANEGAIRANIKAFLEDLIRQANRKRRPGA